MQLVGQGAFEQILQHLVVLEKYPAYRTISNFFVKSLISINFEKERRNLAIVSLNDLYQLGNSIFNEILSESLSSIFINTIRVNFFLFNLFSDYMSESLS